ncbi:MAG: hypothetical protein GTO45_05265 [Candidatus Aminicenantes bacterium]|nr:hypothetical protein [Candidatus Aminicenantes bacterium]NIN17495.1 hypothetical protein [Candidatus Aminicenantes bacterium]NIN41381.1 hypothetical protein [Candidatus Aminicenantes bacterium]NIN84147.1 hypothetical protein [Candidatus Aminicenantes bacterium]NIO86707.1 hypothetical protein [Candidatus Aminicenantes bacterium]
MKTKSEFDKEIKGMSTVTMADLIYWMLYSNERGRVFFDLSRLYTEEPHMHDKTSKPTNIPYMMVRERMKSLSYECEYNKFHLTFENLKETLLKNFPETIQLPARWVFWRSIEKGIPSQGVLPEELQPGR